MKLSCAAKHLCIAKHIPVGTRTKCKDCKEYMHDFCTGLAATPPTGFFDDRGGYSCAICTNKLVQRFITSPEGRALHMSQRSQSPLLPLPVQMCTPAETPTMKMLGNIPVYRELGKKSYLV